MPSVEKHREMDAGAVYISILFSQECNPPSVLGVFPLLPTLTKTPSGKFVWWHSGGRQRQADLCEFKASLVYKS